MNAGNLFDPDPSAYVEDPYAGAATSKAVRVICLLDQWHTEYGEWLTPPRPIIQKWLEAVKANARWEISVAEDLLSALLDEKTVTVDEHLARLPERDDTDVRILLQRMCSLEHTRGDVGRIPKVELTI